MSIKVGMNNSVTSNYNVSISNVNSPRIITGSSKTITNFNSSSYLTDVINLSTKKLNDKDISNILASDNPMDIVNKYIANGYNKKDVLLGLQSYIINNYDKIGDKERTNYYEIMKCENLDDNVDLSKTGTISKKTESINALINNHNAFFQYLDRFNNLNSTQTKLELEEYHNCFEKMVNSNELISPNVLFRMIKLNEAYLNSDYTLVRQYCVNKVITNPDSKEYEDVSNLIKKYYPEYSDKNVKQYMSIINTCGVCTYASFANEIVDLYKNHPSDFKRDFGYDLYIYDKNGNKRVNDTMLLTDIFCYVNKDNEKISALDSDGNLIAKDDQYQERMINTYEGRNNPDEIGFLKSKNPSINLTTGNLVNSMQDVSKEDIVANIKKGMSSGKNYDIAVSPYKDSTDGSYNLYTLDGDVYQTMDVGHSMSVVGITDDGNLIVDTHHSQKNYCYIKWNEIYSDKVGFYITEDDLTY